jgi:hypothetical protein
MAAKISSGMSDLVALGSVPVAVVVPQLMTAASAVAAPVLT